MRRPARWLIAAAGLAGLAPPAGGADPVPAPSRVHDPCLIEAGGTFYAFSTGRGVPIRTSRDLIRWERGGAVWPDNPPEWARAAIPQARDLWAPDVSRQGGEYRVYYSVSSFGSQRSAIGLATNGTLDRADPGYRWVDRGPVVESRPGRDDFNAIDPNVVADEAGRPWLAFGSFWGGLKIVPLDPATGKPDPARREPPRTIAARPGDHAIEAPFVSRKGDWFYLFASVDHCCRGAASDYKVVVGRSRRVDGPYLDLDGRSMVDGGGSPLLAGSGAERGPGHNAVLRLGDGSELLAHHYYDAADGGTPKLRVRRLAWGADGFPLPGAAVAGGVAPPPPLAGDALRRSLVAHRWDYAADFADPTPIRLVDGGRIEAERPGGTWEVAGAALTLRWAPDRADACVVAPDGRSFVGRNPRHEVVQGVARGD